MIYNIIDIETTGGSFGNLITEIGVVKMEDDQVLSQWHSLINPGVPIPTFISRLTGITNDMVANAPAFRDVAEDLYAFLEDGVFVAHNVGFDYPIVKSQYEKLRHPFTLKKLCTVRLARKIMPNMESYSLGKICKALDINIVDHHRALADAKATSELFGILVRTDQDDFITASLKRNNREVKIPPHMDKAEFDQLPETTGVYYFLSKENKVLYCGKAKNIKQRVLNHLDGSSKKKAQMIRDTHHIDFQSTASELYAYLLEDLEIKKHYPPYNRAQKRTGKPFTIFSYKDRRGVIRLDVADHRRTPKPILTVNNLAEAKVFLNTLAETHELCLNYTGFSHSPDGCVNSYLDKCHGVCRDKESIEDYNARVQGVIGEINSMSKEEVLYIEPARDGSLCAVHALDGVIQGIGLVESNIQIQRATEVLDYLKPVKANADLNRILKFYTNKFPQRLEVIPMEAGTVVE
jgi:DNA polymerase-3 subunit epsilon